jgi:hypothetical protein
VHQLEVTYNFNSLEALLLGVTKYSQMYTQNNLPYEHKILIGENTFIAIFVI